MVQRFQTDEKTKCTTQREKKAVVWGAITAVSADGSAGSAGAAGAAGASGSSAATFASSFSSIDPQTVSKFGLFLNCGGLAPPKRI